MVGWQVTQTPPEVWAVTRSRLVLPVGGSGVLEAPGGGAPICVHRICFSRKAPRRMGEVRSNDEYEERNPTCVNTPDRCVGSRFVSCRLVVKLPGSRP